MVVEHQHPAAFGGFQLHLEGIDSGYPALAPGGLGPMGIAIEHGLCLIGEEGGLLADALPPGQGQGDHRQAEADQQDRQLPEQRVTARHHFSPRVIT
ncbi:hypothetical protein D3C78_1806780 [compost metagenome]